MRHSVITVIAPEAEPITVAELAAFARIDDDIAVTDGPLIMSFIQAARTAAENYTRRSFITRTLKATLDTAAGSGPWMPGYYELPVNYFDAYLPTTIELRHGPVIGVASITNYDTANAATVYSDDNYALFGDRIVLNSGSAWPSNLRGTSGTEIVYTAGFGPAAGDVPHPIRTAITIHAASLYDNRGACDMPGMSMQLLNQYRAL